jgi:hypothetical protein
MGVWRKLQNEKLHNLYFSPRKLKIINSRTMGLAEHVAQMKTKRNVYRLLVRKPEGKRPAEKRRHGLVDNIKTELKEIGWGVVDWIGLAQDRNQ